MIGREFTNPQRVVVLLIAQDGRQHGFEVYPGTMRWEWTGTTDYSPIGAGSTGRVTVEGRFHRMDRSGDLALPPPAW